jgi:hypothetical protein
MNYGPEHLKAEALKAAERQLKKAATFTSLNIKNPLFQKRLGTGSTSVLVRFEWPGVLTVLDPETGNVLAASQAGCPDTLSPDFAAPVPALGNAGHVGDLQCGKRGHQ